MYHRVASLEVDPWALCVTAQHFAEHLEVLKKEARPISLKQLVQAHTQGQIPDRAVVVTFDDGYADNLYCAKPLLEQYDIPATVFVASGHVGHQYEFWWDELERILLQPGTLPELLALNINGKTYQWELGGAAEYSGDKYQNDCGWTVDWQEAPGLRQSLYLSLHQLVQPLPEAEQRQVMDTLQAWSGRQLDRRPTHHALSREELLTLSRGELIEVGSHTVTHPFLAALSKRAQLDEIQRSKTFLEESIGRPVRNFAYPYGIYAKETVKIVRKAGFDSACATTIDYVWRGSRRFQLPRVGIENLDGEGFSGWLSQMFDCEKIV